MPSSPDAFGGHLTGEFLKGIEASGPTPAALRLKQLSPAEAERFYEVHKERTFYRALCDYMMSGPVVLAVLSGEGAIARWRELMGATDPAKAAAGTLRRTLAT